MLIKIGRGIKSICIFLKYKIIYLKKIQIKPINSIRGKLRVVLLGKSQLKIGDFLMCLGPLNLKCLDSGILTIGKNVFFNHNCSITCAENIHIGDNCMFANNVVIIDHNHKIENGMPKSELISKSVIIGNNVWCGANVTILPGVTIGDGAVIGAGSVVTKDIPPHVVAVGNPCYVKK